MGVVASTSADSSDARTRRCIDPCSTSVDSSSTASIAIGSRAPSSPGPNHARPSLIGRSGSLGLTALDGFHSSAAGIGSLAPSRSRTSCGSHRPKLLRPGISSSVEKSSTSSSAGPGRDRADSQLGCEVGGDSVDGGEGSRLDIGRANIVHVRRFRKPSGGHERLLGAARHYIEQFCGNRMAGRSDRSGGIER